MKEIKERMSLFEEALELMDTIPEIGRQRAATNHRGNRNKDEPISLRDTFGITTRR
jgi:hypothetical protein